MNYIYPRKDGLIVMLAGTLSLLLVSVSIAYSAEVTTTGSVTPYRVTTPTWNVGDDLYIGRYSGTSTLNVEDGGVVSNVRGYLAYSSGSIGTVIVTGANSQWNNSSSLFVGEDGTGTLIIENGGVVSSAFVIVGRDRGSIGAIHLNGGTLSTPFLTERDGSGTVTFDGGTLQITKSYPTQLTNFEPGDVTLAAGGGTIDIQASTVATEYALEGVGGLTKIGYGSLTLSGANIYKGGTVVRDGTLAVTGSVTHSDSDLTVGSQSGDNGTLDLSGTGMVSSRTGVIGNSADSTGLAKVSGGSWTNSRYLAVGYEGDGSLEISGTGQVSATEVLVAYAGSATGSINLEGGTLTTGQVSEGDGTGTVTFDGGTLQLSGDQADLFSGFETNDVTLAAGGGTIDTQAFTVATSQALDGAGALTKTGTGSLTLSGANTYTGGTVVRDGTLVVTGSIANEDSNFIVGSQNGDSGTLEIFEVGTISNTFGILGDVAGATGLAKVSGGSWANSRNLTIGLSGVGTLDISGTGMVFNSAGNIGYGIDSRGLVTVNGGNWTNSGNLTVGLQGDGILDISDAGMVSNVSSKIGYVSGSTGLVRVSGGTWTNSEKLSIGNSGAGTLEVSGTGQVNAAEVIVAARGTGTLNLNGGILTAGQVFKGDGTGTVTFDGGSLQLLGDQTNLFRGFDTGDVSLAGGGGTIDTQVFDVASSNALGGAGSLTKKGTGILTLFGVNTYTGGTNLQAGALYVEGSLADGVVTVVNDTLLGGSGSIAGDVSVQAGGTLSPGSSPGILTVGSLDLDAGATTVMELNGLTPGVGYDQIVVNGIANLGGDLTLSFDNNEPVNGQSYVLIDADVINGDFENINLLFDQEMVYETLITDDYIFNIIGIETDFANVVGLDPELVQIATLLDDNFADRGLIPTIDALNLVPATSQPLAFQQISPKELTVLENFTFANTRLVSTRLKNRQRAVREGATGFSTAGFNLYDESGQQIRNSLIADTSQDLPVGVETQPLSHESGLSSYISGSGTARDFDGDSAGPGYEDDSFSILLGANYRLDDDLAIGAYLGYNRTDADLQEDGGDADLDSYRLGFTGTYWNPLGDTTSCFTTAHLGFAHHEYDTKRNAFGGTASGDTDAFEMDLGAAVGYEMNLCEDLLLTTVLGLDYINLDMDGFTESGSDAPLAINDDRSESFYSTLSFRLDYSREYRGIKFLPYVHAGWRHEYLDDSNSVAARFASSPGVGGFTVEGASVARDSLVGGLGLSAELHEGLILQLGYYGETSSDFESHSLFGAMNYAF